MASAKRLSPDDYYMNVAWVVSQRSNCMKRKVGAIIVVKHYLNLSNSMIPSTGIASAGYNGTPYNVRNCDEGGCARCASGAKRQEGYDWCICVHAEQNAIALSARHGVPILGASMYVTTRPCILCLKEAIQAGIGRIYFDQEFTYKEAEKEAAYQQLLRQSGIALYQHELKSPLSIEKGNAEVPQMPLL